MKKFLKENIFVVIPVFVILLLFCLIVGVAMQKKAKEEKENTPKVTQEEELKKYLASLPSPTTTSSDGNSDYNYIVNGEELWDYAGNRLSIDYYEKLSANVNRIMTENGYKGMACSVNTIDIHGLKCNLSFDIKDTNDKLFVNSDYADRTFDGYIKKSGS